MRTISPRPLAKVENLSHLRLDGGPVGSLA